MTGLDPGTTYTFAVRARTDSHGMNQNTVYSEYATATLTNPDGTLKWAFETGNGVFSSPAIGPDGAIYVGSDDNKLYAINPDGTQKWAFQTGGALVSSPAIGTDGTIYVGSEDTKLYAINPDGTQKWAFETGGEVWSPPPP